MNQNLNRYRPTPEALAGIKRQLIDSGIPPESIPDAWVEATIAAMARWIQTTEEGAKATADLMGFEHASGSSDKEYFVYQDEGLHERPVKPEDVLYFRGVFVEQRPVPIAYLHAKDKVAEYCEDCGILGPCTKVVVDPGLRQLVRLCNHCLKNHSNAKIYDQADSLLCERCPKSGCSHHPKRQPETQPRRLHA